MYLSLIFFFFLSSYVLETILQCFQWKTLKKNIPQEFQNIYTSEEMTKMKHYVKHNIIFSFIKNTFFIGALCWFLFYNGFFFLSFVLKGFYGGDFAHDLLFCLLFFAGLFFIQIPFSLYHTFCIEKRFNLTSITFTTFLLDIIKTLFISLLLGIPLLMLVVLIFSFFQKEAWLIVCGVLIFWQIFVSFIAPIVILPLFNKFQPLGNSSLKGEIEKYCKKHNFPFQGVFIADGSRRSNKGNAFFIGFGQSKRIVLFDTLLDNMTTDEIMAILAHEMGHYKLKHILKNQILSIIQTFFMVYLFNHCLQSESFLNEFLIFRHTVLLLIPIFFIYYQPFSFLFGINTLFLSRKYEYQADNYSLRTYPQSESLIKALKKLLHNHFAPLTAHPLCVFFQHSHPPIINRVKNIRKKSC